MPNPTKSKPTNVIDLERNDLEGALYLYREAKRKGKPLDGDQLRMLCLSFDDSGDAFWAAVEASK